MERKVSLVIGGCMTAALLGAAPPPVLAAPKAHTRLVAAVSPSSSQVFTFRYVVFTARPKTPTVAAKYKSFPPVFAQPLNNDSRYAMTSTPDGFTRVLQAQQTDYNFHIALAGSTLLYNHNVTWTQITDGPNPADPYAQALTDKITINQNPDTTLDFVSQGSISFRAVGANDDGCTTSWNGENKELMIGRTYLWGGDTKPDGTCLTWAFCILPGNVDQVASAWNRSNGVRKRVVALGKKAMAVQKKGGNE